MKSAGSTATAPPYHLILAGRGWWIHSALAIFGNKWREEGSKDTCTTRPWSFWSRVNLIAWLNPYQNRCVGRCKLSAKWHVCLQPSSTVQNPSTWRLHSACVFMWLPTSVWSNLDLTRVSKSQQHSACEKMQRKTQNDNLSWSLIFKEQILLETHPE